MDPSLHTESNASLILLFGASKFLLAHTMIHVKATKNPAPQANLSPIRPLPQISLLISPSPIPITLSDSLQLTLLMSSENRKRQPTAPYASPHSQDKEDFLDLHSSADGEAFNAIPSFEVLTSPQLYTTEHRPPLLLDFRPTESPPRVQAQSPGFSLPKSVSAQASLSLLLIDPSMSALFSLFLSKIRYPAKPNSPPKKVSQTSNSSALNFGDSSPLAIQSLTAPASQDLIDVDFRGLFSPPQNSHMMISSPQTNIQNCSKTRLKKEPLQATRRSERLRLKGSQLGVQTQRPKSRSEKLDLNFLPNSHNDSIDATSAIQILKATGLHISGQIQDMIDIATAQDQGDDSAGPSQPSTPLHDIIPPLAVPGIDILL